ncbi:hypothetical protein M413DRAFT_11036 [Hebeloma cylindrosporum]|uniref:F-box domain-containing protein n=1 Tax=Hebeloma cylindrosporum TaxID=76867 RepID=A0A0C3CCX3_HEBCY|nr:hypothetical protein M413DRAFT_11036 [Hebeloma cylindrosporum h7]
MAALSPVCSLKKLLKAAPPPSTSSTSRAPIERLPTHLILEIGRQSPLRGILHLSRCSRRLRTLFAPVLYSTVELKTNKQCKVTLVALSKRPELSRHIRHLIVRPNTLEWTDPGDEIDEDLVATLIASMAKQLRTLEAFEWDGMEMPNDTLWMALKRSIATTIGEEPINPSSPLWDFDDLRRVSLTVKCHSLDWLAEGLPKIEKLPKKFWAMLLERCPRLEELTIGGPAPSPRVFDIRHITAGRWLRLRSITIGDMVLISSTQTSVYNMLAEARIFLPLILPSIALPNLSSFGGPLKFVKTLPNPRRLRHLTLTCLHHSTSAFPPTLAVLQELKTLVSLSVWIDLSFGQSYGLGARTSGENGVKRGQQRFDDVLVMQSLLSSSPGLKELDVACFTRPTFGMREFSRILQVAPKLESFILTKVHKSNEEDLTRSAARIAVENPNLRKFTLRTTQDSWFSAARGRVRQLGVYELFEQQGSESRDAGVTTSMTNGMDMDVATIRSLLSFEWGQRSFTGKEYSRHFVHPLTQMLTQKEKEREPQQGPPLSTSAKHNRHHPKSHSVQLPPSHVSTVPSLKGPNSRIRRASYSVVGSITAIWQSQNLPVTAQQTTSPVASPRSSISSGSASLSASGHGGVTWADQVESSLGRSGSGSTTGSGSGGGACTRSEDSHAQRSALKNSRRASRMSEPFKQRDGIMDGYIFA